ncbi:MAG: hypothetical protein A2096_04835 [Spirochaetes bacterium GWF1_41_5]|nr:MAG: hypothetical protein A2096_04835 [Spirochaetes bacterium GWF1_41_5]
MHYINGIGSIGPQEFSGGKYRLSPTAPEFFQARPIDYKTWINPLVLRKFSRIVKMGTVAALMCLKDGGIEKPGAIITGTALGCLENTEGLLKQIFENGEKFLNPTLFISSTHNAIAAHIAIHTACRGYNCTYSQRAISFESALLDGMLQITEKKENNILIGGIDEIIPALLPVLKNLGLQKKKSSSTRGSNWGEGAVFINLSAQKNEHTYAQLAGLRIVSRNCRPDDIVRGMLKSAGLDQNKMLLLTGVNKDRENDKFCHKLAEDFPGSAHARYKHLCGEYFTAASFALSLAASMLKNGIQAESLLRPGPDPDSIMIYNQSRNIHSFILIRKAT